MKIKIFMTCTFLMVSGYALSQEKSSSNLLKEDHIVIDVSKSHPTNRTLDRIYYLNINSTSVSLPADVMSFLDSIDDGNDLNLHSKLTSQRIEILKILYNKRISPEDKRFLCEHYLRVESIGVNPIKSILQNYLNNGEVGSI